MNEAGPAALVTGGATGIGRAIVNSLADAGARGLVCDLGEVPGELPGGWVSVSADVRQEAELERAFAEAGKQFPSLDIVVANAGVVPGWRDTESIDLGEWDDGVCYQRARGHRDDQTRRAPDE